jgi:two-component system, chemotaxis family, sensor kinase CheA
MDNNALKNEFLVESFENLSSINEDLTLLEKDPHNKDLLNKIYRTVHTMKGSAGFLGLKKLQEVTHLTENLLDELREGKMVLTSEMVDILLQSFDICQGILKSIEADNNEGQTDTAVIKEILDDLLNGNHHGDLSLAVETQDNVMDDDEELNELIQDHRKQNRKVETKVEENDSDISQAAMDSLRELIGEGKIDESVLTEINASSTKTPAQAIAVVQEDDSDISEAAMASLRELIGEGKIDATVLEEIKSETKPAVKQVVKQEAKPTPSAPQPVVKKIENAIPEEKPVVMNRRAEDPDLENTDANLLESRNSIADSFVRVNVSVLDKIMNIVGELVLNRNQIVQFANQENNHTFTKLAQHLNVITSELQSEVMSTRMQPIGSILTKFERLVRDFSRTTGKKINLKLSGQETELDKTLIEAIKDPLVHIIRNACDHGLESIAEREAMEKNTTGTIWIKAYNESGQVTIEIVDDGRGLDYEKIGKKAIEKGIITKEEFAKMNEQQVYGLIFAPGFSTAEKVTNISGRGVGMDVVKTNIEKIGGSVSLSSKLKEGTTFKLRIPLTLAIVPALIIRSTHEFFAVPQLNLVELVRLESPEEKALIERIQGSEFLKLRGKLTPVFRLNDAINLKQVHDKSLLLNSVLDSNNADASKKTKSKMNIIEDAENIIIMQAEDLDFGIIVDEILDTEEIVVKPLGSALKHLGLFGGATIMGDGKVALILDALGFLNTVSSTRDRIKEDHFLKEEQNLRIEAAGELQENLLFRLGDKRIYAMPLQLVTRLEEFPVSKIEKTGNQPVIRYLNAPMPLVNIEKTLKLSGKSMIERYHEEKVDVISCIVTTIRGKNFGIVVDEIRDISIDNTDIDTTAVDRDGILGTIFVADSTISLLDIYRIIDAQGLGVKAKIGTEQLKKNKNKKILLVDDSAMYRKMEADALAEHGYQVDVANNGEHGFQTLVKNQYDLLITDIEMPVLDGFDFAKKVRTESSQKDITIVALSTRTSNKDIEKGKQSGFDYHLEKFRKDEVIELVDKILTGES